MDQIKQRKKIGVLGGSFNPIHQAHTKMAEIAIRLLNLDILYFIPAKKSPFKSKNAMIIDNLRLEMISNVLPEKAKINDYEISRNKTSYTINTLRYLKKQFPEEELFLIIGSDHLKNLHLWKQIYEIPKLAQIVALKRGQIDAKRNIKKYKVKVFDNELIKGSSSKIRIGDFTYLHPINRKLLTDNLLMIDIIASSTLSLKRYIHSKATAKLAAEYAKINGLSAKKAYFAGFAHDITKEWSETKHRNFLQKYGVEHKDIPTKVLHQHTGALWFSKLYGSEDQEIFNAINRHTTAHIEMTKFDKVIFLADKLSKGRKFPNIQKEREVALKNIDLAFSRAIIRMKDFLEAKGVKTSKQFEEICKKWSTKSMD